MWKLSRAGEQMNLAASLLARQACNTPERWHSRRPFVEEIDDDVPRIAYGRQ
jgi:hypothetical protein